MEIKIGDQELLKKISDMEIEKAAAQTSADKESDTKNDSPELIKDELEIKKEITKLSKEEREKLGFNLNYLGLSIEQKKNEFFSGVFNWIAETNLHQNKTTTLFCREHAKSFETKASIAHKKAVEVKEAVKDGKNKHALANIGSLVANGLKYGRILADFGISSPLRGVMLGAMAFTAGAETATEMRLKNEELIKKTRITDIKLATEEADRIYKEAITKAGEGNVTSEALKQAYLVEMPKDLQNRLNNPGAANGLIQETMKKHLNFSVGRLNKSIMDIEDNKKLSKEKKETKKTKLLKKWEKNLKDYDRVITQFGTIDELGMWGHYAQKTGKVVVQAMMIETAYLLLDKLFENIAGIHLSGALSNVGGYIKKAFETNISHSGEESHNFINHETITDSTGATIEKPIIGQSSVLDTEQSIPPTTPEAGTSDTLREVRGVIHRIHLDNNSTNFDKNELKTLWGGEHGTGINTEGNYVFNVSNMTASGSMHGNLSENIQELMRSGHLKMLVTMNDGKVMEFTINADGQVMIPHELDGAFSTENGHAVFNGKFAEVVLDKGNNNFEVISTVTHGSGAEHFVPPDAEPQHPVHATHETTPEEENAPSVEGPTNTTRVPRGLHEVQPGDGIISDNQINHPEDATKIHNDVHHGPIQDTQRTGVDFIPDNQYHSGYMRGGSGSIQGPQRTGVDFIPDNQYHGRVGDYGVWQRPSQYGRMFYNPGYPHLSEEMFNHVNRVYDSALYHMFPNNGEMETVWDTIRNTRADEMMRMTPIEGDSHYSNLISFMHRLQDRIEDNGGGSFKPRGRLLFRGPETVSQYLRRAMEKAASMGILDGIEMP